MPLRSEKIKQHLAEVVEFQEKLYPASSHPGIARMTQDFTSLVLILVQNPDLSAFEAIKRWSESRI